MIFAKCILFYSVFSPAQSFCFFLCLAKKKIILNNKPEEPTTFILFSDLIPVCSFCVVLFFLFLFFFVASFLKFNLVSFCSSFLLVCCGQLLKEAVADKTKLGELVKPYIDNGYPGRAPCCLIAL